MFNQHALITACFCAAIAALSVFGCPASLCFLPAAFYMGRELAQAEGRYIKAGTGKRADYPWYCGFYKEAWDRKGLLDWLEPLAVAAESYAAIKIFWM